MLGLDVVKDAVELRNRIGLISHNPLLYPDLTAEENLLFFAEMYGVEDPKARIRELLEAVELDHRRLDLVRTFSRGMLQRLSIARALLHRPEVLFLDEPYSGLDPHAMDILDSLIAQIRSEHTFVMVSHDLAKGLELCSHALILARGRSCCSSRRSEHRRRRVRGDVPLDRRDGGGLDADAPPASLSARQFTAILRKDIVMELRTKEMLTSMGLYTLLTMVDLLSRAAAGRRRGFDIAAHRGRPAVARVRVHLDAGAEPLARAREGPGLPRGAAALAGRPPGHLLRQGDRQPHLPADRRGAHGARCSRSCSCRAGGSAARSGCSPLSLVVGARSASPASARCSLPCR